MLTNESLRLLRGAAIIATFLGAAGSLAFMLWTGRHSSSLLLQLIFAVWVLSPSIFLLWANMISSGWRDLTRAALYGVMVVVAIASLLIYAAAVLGPPRSKPASIFVIVPPASCVLAAMILLIVAFASGRRANRG